MKFLTIPATGASLLLALSHPAAGLDYNEIPRDIYQSDADGFERFAITPTGLDDSWYNYIFNLKQDVTFKDYQGGTFPPREGNVFLYGNSSTSYRKLTTLRGEGSDSFNLVFDDNHSVYTGSYDGDASKHGGAAYFSHVMFRDLKSVVFSNNSLDNQCTTTPGYQAFTFGGGMKAYQVNVDNVGEFVVQGNTASGREAVFGGGIYSTKFVTGQLVEGSSYEFVEGTGTGNITFRDNKVIVQTGGQSGYGGGYSNLEGAADSSDHFQNTGTVRFDNNHVVFADTLWQTLEGVTSMYGGAIHSTNTYFTQTQNVELTNNSVDATNQTHAAIVHGGAASTGGISFRGVQNAGSSPYALLVDGNRALTNGSEKSAGYGGAFSTYRLWIYESQDAMISNNYATTKGGALYLKKYSSSLSSGLYAEDGDITFRGNTDSLTEGNKRESGTANAIHVQETDDGKYTLIYLKAMEGREINFYDPVTSDSSTYDKFGFYINTVTEDPGTGTIRFSGKHVAETLAGSEHRADYTERLANSKKSDINATILLGNGKLILEHGVTLGRKYEAADPDKGTGAQIGFRGGMLDISGSAEHGDTTLAASLIDFEGGTAVTLKGGAQAFFDANDITMESGIGIDLGYYFSGGAKVDHDGIIITAERLTLDGSVLLADTGANFYRTEDWLNDMDFVLFDVAGVDEINGDLTGITTASSGSNVVSDQLLYQGEWSVVQENQKIIARWTSYRIAPIPEPAGVTLGALGIAALGLRRRRARS